MLTILKVRKPCSVNRNTPFKKRVKRCAPGSSGGRRTLSPASLGLSGRCCPQAPSTRPPPRCPGKRSAPPREQRSRSPRDRQGCQLICSCRSGNHSGSQKRRQERVNLQTEKVQTKGERGAKGKQVEYLPAENRETKNEESPASDEAGEKEAKSD